MLKKKIQSRNLTADRNSLRLAKLTSVNIFNDVTKDIILRKAILLLLTQETLDIASCVIYTVVVVETDYRTSSLKSRGRYRQLS